MYGVPLKVAPPKMTSEEKEEFNKLKKRRDSLNKQLKDIKDSQEEQLKGTKNQLESIKKRISFLKKSDQGVFAGFGDCSGPGRKLFSIGLGSQPLFSWLPW